MLIKITKYERDLILESIMLNKTNLENRLVPFMLANTDIRNTVMHHAENKIESLSKLYKKLKIGDN